MLNHDQRDINPPGVQPMEWLTLDWTQDLPQ
ncbi:hypothetical protein FB106_101355 [Synechococcus sp. Ace-Pa]|nr:hypothetical protein FB106_101355 [Synechococcus sp. Ace-Pa]